MVGEGATDRRSRARHTSLPEGVPYSPPAALKARPSLARSSPHISGHDAPTVCHNGSGSTLPSRRFSSGPAEATGSTALVGHNTFRPRTSASCPPAAPRVLAPLALVGLSPGPFLLESTPSELGACSADPYRCPLREGPSLARANHDNGFLQRIEPPTHATSTVPRGETSAGSTTNVSPMCTTEANAAIVHHPCLCYSCSADAQTQASSSMPSFPT